MVGLVDRRIGGWFGGYMDELELVGLVLVLVLVACICGGGD